MNKKGQVCPLGGCGICPFCQGAVGSGLEGFVISGSAIATASISGVMYKYKMKIKNFYNTKIRKKEK